MVTLCWAGWVAHRVAHALLHPPGTCWTWTPSPSLTQVGGGAGQGAQRGTGMARHGSPALLLSLQWLSSSCKAQGAASGRR